jgi:hypothetical protein
LQVTIYTLKCGAFNLGASKTSQMKRCKGGVGVEVDVEVIYTVRCSAFGVTVVGGGSGRR